ncbi:MAG: hypothetical protein JXR68_11915 [Bacteroidales bacterium]|nr:hypothetical protein [Bacteroidales bacterium]
MAELIEIELYLLQSETTIEVSSDYSCDERSENLYCTKSAEIEKIEVYQGSEFEIYHTYEKGVVFCNGEIFKKINFEGNAETVNEDFVITLLPGYYHYYEDGITIKKIREY